MFFCVSGEMNARLLYMSTDSCIMEIPDDQDLTNIGIGAEMGAFKHQIPNCKRILKFYCLGLHCYNVTYETFANDIKQISRVSGFNLNQTVSQDSLSSDDFDDLLQKAIQHEKSGKSVPQVQKKSNASGLSTLQLTKRYLSNDLRTRRVVTEDGANSKPFGWH